MTRWLALTTLAVLMAPACAPVPDAIPPGVLGRLESTHDLSHVRAAVLTGDGFHDAEAMIPMAFLRQRGAEVTILGPEPGEVTAYNSDHTLTIQLAAADADPAAFDVLILPGGRAPDAIRQDEGVVAFARDFFHLDRPVAAICHGAQVLITAGVIEGRTLTCVAAIEEEVVEAQGIYVDRPVVVDGNLITSRLPGDIPDFAIAIALALVEDRGPVTSPVME
jgi:protease I